MPSDHGAAVVRHVLETPALTRLWREELDEMRARVADNRRQLAAIDPRFGFVGQQEGMFSMLHLEPAAIQKLKVEHGVYMASSGRINVAGFCGDDIPRFAKAVAAVVG
jgi:aromatic-amino-acid transaminase